MLFIVFNGLSANKLVCFVGGVHLASRKSFKSQNGEMAFPGKLGAEWDETQGYEAAKLCGLNALAQLHDAAGSLNAIASILRPEGYVHAAPGYRGRPEVLNGASDLMNEVFGDAGKHARVAPSVWPAIQTRLALASLPLFAPTP